MRIELTDGSIKNPKIQMAMLDTDLPAGYEEFRCAKYEYINAFYDIVEADAVLNLDDPDSPLTQEYYARDEEIKARSKAEFKAATAALESEKAALIALADKLKSQAENPTPLADNSGYCL